MVGQPIQVPQEIGSFTYYKASDEGLYCISCYGPAHGQIGSRCSGPIPELIADIAALERIGYVNRTKRGEYLDYRTWEWRRRDAKVAS